MKAAILGMGAMGQVHKEVYEAAGVEVVATYDPKTPDRRFSISEGYEKSHDPDGYGVVAETIKDAEIVSICSTDDVHAAQIIQALDMGKHVFCEKPLCHTRREFEAIKAAYEPKKGKCVLGMNFPLRWHEPFVEAKRKIESGELGEIYLVEADYEYGRLYKITGGWRGQMDYYNIVMGGGLHMIDLLFWFGAEIHNGDTVAASLVIPPDLATVTSGRLQNGGVFKLTCDFAGNKNHARRLRICGTKGSLYIDDREPTDKARALMGFLYYLSAANGTGRASFEDVPSPGEIFRVHEIGLSL